MTQKSSLQRAARAVQGRLGISYQGAVNRLRAKEGAGMAIEQAVTEVLIEAGATGPGLSRARDKATHGS